MPHGIRNTEGRQHMSKSAGKPGKGGKPDEGGTNGEGGAGNPGAEDPGEGDPTDWKAEARKWEARSKENKTALESLTSRLEALETSNGDLSKKVTEYESKAQRAEREAAEKTERDALVDRIAKDSGVPASALRGADETELTAHAETLKEIMPSAPVIPGQGNNPGNTGSDEMREFTRELFDNAKD